MSITTTYDPGADALQIQFGASAGVVRTTVVRPGVHLEFDDSGRLVGLEVLDASHVLRADALRNLADGTEWLTLSEAAEAAKLSASTLRGQLNKGRIVGEKRNRDWVISRHVLETYLDEVEQRAVQPARSTGAILTYRDDHAPFALGSVKQASQGEYAAQRSKTASKLAKLGTKLALTGKTKAKPYAKKTASSASAATRGGRKGK